VFFTTKQIGRLDNTPLLTELASDPDAPATIILRGDAEGFGTYQGMLQRGSRAGPDYLYAAESKVLPHLICNLQFTSGTTGHPKAASLSHHNIVNNSRFIGDRMRLGPNDVLCCPPPLFHCFGLVLGLMAIITHGGKIVYPAEVFDTKATLAAIEDEQCTAIHGVPAMFDSLLSLPEAKALDPQRLRLRTGIIAGAPVPRYLMELLVSKLGMTEFTSSYGLTEASPTCFNAFTDDPIDVRLSTVGTIMPHARAKIVDRDGQIVPVGARGELCISGYQLQAGYWNNSEKTAECMVRDESGVLWLHTGDEAAFDERGYCKITGRFKDIIIRGTWPAHPCLELLLVIYTRLTLSRPLGGENIYPLEIEERLAAHPSVATAIVVGLPDTHYGEVVGAFLAHEDGSSPMPRDDEVRDWVRRKLGKHKAPAHIFWLGRNGIPATVPLTGSGKVRKFEMAQLGRTLLDERTKAKL
jgi:long-chain acyl-CoA synthetase